MIANPAHVSICLLRRGSLHASLNRPPPPPLLLLFLIAEEEIDEALEVLRDECPGAPPGEPGGGGGGRCRFPLDHEWRLAADYQGVGQVRW